MERVRVLIQKLEAQSAGNEVPAALLATVHQLTAELEALLPRMPQPASGRVAVLLPAGFIPASAPVAGAPAPQPKPEAVLPPEPEAVPATVPVSVVPEPVFSMPSEPVKNAETSKPTLEPIEPIEPLEPTEPLQPLKSPEPYSIKPPVFNPIEDVPTLEQQASPAPAPPAPSATGGESLNDRLRRQETELAHKLTGAPIKDLRKGIGINDRYLFVAELFRGDEAMYERSIKTINGFDILPEAEYWINRELKVKLGWDDSVDTVQHFYGLVRRRFS